MENNFRATAKFESCGALTLSWSTSKGRDTYGYNICRLDSKTARYKCMGGGYDMIGDTLGQFLQAEFQDRLQVISERAGSVYSKVSLDGACGVSTMIEIAEAMNISISYIGNKRGQTTGFMYTVYAMDKGD